MIYKTLMNTEKSTQIHAQRKELEFNRQSIIKALGLNTLDYQTIMFDLGVEYLEDLYPPKTEYEEYYRLYSRDPLFWKWWRAEYGRKELDTLSFNDDKVLVRKMKLKTMGCDVSTQHPRPYEGKNIVTVVILPVKTVEVYINTMRAMHTCETIDASFKNHYIKYLTNGISKRTGEKVA